MVCMFTRSGESVLLCKILFSAVIVLGLSTVAVLVIRVQLQNVETNWSSSYTGITSSL